MIMKSDLKGDVVEPFPFARLEHYQLFLLQVTQIRYSLFGLYVMLSTFLLEKCF
jgi:hypothetical protein